MDKYDNNIVNKDGEINVISRRKKKLVCHIDNIVATLWSTLYFAKNIQM